MTKENYSFIVRIKKLIKERFPFISDEIALLFAAQSALETSYGKSIVYLDNNNLFGMKLPKVRMSCAIGEMHNHAVYTGDICSICDYMFWLQYNGFTRKDLSSTDYFLIMRKICAHGFNTSDKYADTVYQIMSNFNSFKNGN